MLTAVALAVLAILVRAALFGKTVTATTVLQTRLASLPLATTEFKMVTKLISTVVAHAQQSAVRVKVVRQETTVSVALVALATLAVCIE